MQLSIYKPCLYAESSAYREFLDTKTMSKFLRHFCILFFLCHTSMVQTFSQEAYSPIPQDSLVFENGIGGLIDRTLAVNEAKKKSTGFFKMPLLYFSPDTRLAFGGFGVYYFKLKSKREGKEPDTFEESSTRLSYVKLLADYTQNRQLDVWASWNIFLKDESYLGKGEFRYRIFPDRFYGIGNRSEEEDVEKFQYNLFSIKLLLLKKLQKGVFVGVDYQFASFHNFKNEAEGQLLQNNILGARGGNNSGFGLVFLIDTRDNVINASNGTLLEFSSYFYKDFFGSDFGYNNYNITYNQYLHLNPAKRHVLAFNTVFNFNAGGTPFMSLATVGNTDILRGYSTNRFRDQNFIGTQAEYRMPLWWRFGLVGFAGVGDVFERLGDVQRDTFKYSVGGGLRFAVNKKERMNIRLDYGFGRDDNRSLYISLTEAF
mgnify:FL=1